MQERRYFKYGLLNKMLETLPRRSIELLNATNKAITDAIQAGSASTERTIQENRDAVTAALTDNRQELMKILAQNRDAINANAAQGQAVLDTSIRASQLDQRPWVGLAEFATIGGTETEDHKGFAYKGVQIVIRNSGKTPAINLSAVTMQTGRNRDDKVRDYDAIVAESKKQREEMSAKLLEEQVRRFPKMADEIRARDKEMRELESKWETDLFPAGQVLAPGIVITQATGGIDYGNLRGGPEDPFRRMTVYILGKITYNDIFSGTPLHTTKFCLMREMGTQFTSCPTGNYMD